MRRGRFPKPVTIPNPSKVEKFGPELRTKPRSILIELAEVEALRLVDIKGLSQEKAGREMGVLRGTIKQVSSPRLKLQTIFLML